MVRGRSGVAVRRGVSANVSRSARAPPRAGTSDRRDHALAHAAGIGVDARVPSWRRLTTSSAVSPSAVRPAPGAPSGSPAALVRGQCRRCVGRSRESRPTSASISASQRRGAPGSLGDEEPQGGDEADDLLLADLAGRGRCRAAAAPGSRLLSISDGGGSTARRGCPGRDAGAPPPRSDRAGRTGCRSLGPADGLAAAERHQVGALGDEAPAGCSAGEAAPAASTSTGTPRRAGHRDDLGSGGSEWD